MKKLKVNLTWLKTTEALSDAELGRLCRGAMEYALSGKAPTLSGSERILWAQARDEVDRQRTSAEHQSVVNKENATNRYESLRIVSNRNESYEKESTPPTTPGKEAPIPKKKISPKGDTKEKNLSPALADAVREFKEMRTRMHKPMTANAIDRFMDRLQKLSQDEQTQVAIIHQSIDHGWTDVYALKDKPRNTRNTLDNYKVVGTNHPNLSEIAMDVDEL